jgi:4-cresol dehydrogenase (hydroxylating)
MPDQLSAAVSAWEAALGRENVSLRPEDLEEAARTTFATVARPVVILRPRSTSEVAETLRIAHAHRIPVYPTSGGKNFGLGGRVATRDGCALLDLGRMKRILELDEELAFVRLEPGVTFRELYAFLKSKGSRLYASTTGGSPDSSVIGNAVDRGDGSGPLGDRALSVCALEVVLPTGEVVHTGFDRFAGSAVSSTQRWGVGPALDGLFLQSNLGIVTELSLWLTPLGRFASTIRFRVASTAKLAPVVDAVRLLRLEGTLRSAVGFWNDYRVFSTEHASAERIERARVTEALGTDARWFGFTSLHAATEELGVATTRRIERVLGAHVDALEIDSKSGDPTSGRELFPPTSPSALYFQGIPHSESLKSVYFKQSRGAPSELHPERDGCGVIWSCPTLPLRGRDCVQAIETAERLFDEHRFEPLFAFVTHGDRAAYFVPMLVYDRAIDGDDARAMACHDTVLSALAGAGYLPHRLGVHSMGALPHARDDYGALILRLKRALDPHDVLAPGRYDFREIWPPEAD